MTLQRSLISPSHSFQLQALPNQCPLLSQLSQTSFMPPSNLYVEDQLDYTHLDEDYLEYDSYDDDPYYPEVPSSAANLGPAKKVKQPKKGGLKRTPKDKDRDGDDDDDEAEEDEDGPW